MLVVRRTADFASLVKLSHTVFAMPFAFSAVVLALDFVSFSWVKVAWIVVCLVTARTAAMAFNRAVDHKWDALNPRTQDRELPRGALNAAQVYSLVVVSSLLFVWATSKLGSLPLALSPIALGLALGYSLMKRYTWACHLILGTAVAFAPGGAWIAMGAPVGLAPVLLVLAVACWVAGFDVFYSLQDRDFDAAHGLYSIPVRWGVRGALVASATLHAVTIGGLAAVGLLLNRGGLYALGVIAIAALLIVEHSLVHRHGLAKINKAFFDINGYVSVAFFTCVLLDRVFG